MVSMRLCCGVTSGRSTATPWGAINLNVIEYFIGLPLHRKDGRARLWAWTLMLASTLSDATAALSVSTSRPTFLCLNRSLGTTFSLSELSVPDTSLSPRALARACGELLLDRIRSMIHCSCALPIFSRVLSRLKDWILPFSS